MIDKALDPDVGLDKNRHKRDTDTDMDFDGSSGIEYSRGRDLCQKRDVDRSADVNQRSSRWMVLTTGDGRVVVGCSRNQLVHSSDDREDRDY